MLSTDSNSDWAVIAVALRFADNTTLFVPLKETALATICPVTLKSLEFNKPLAVLALPSKFATIIPEEPVTTSLVIVASGIKVNLPVL